MKKVKLLVSVVTVLAGIVACASVPQKRTYDIVWPLPPEQPRIRFVEMFYSNMDVEKAASFSEKLFGEDNPQFLVKPYGVAVDRDGRVYVTCPRRVFVFDKKGGRLDFIGDQPGTGQLKRPIGIAVAPDGRVYVSDVGSARVFIYDSKGRFISAIGHGSEFQTPAGLAIDGKLGRLYVVDTREHHFRAYTLNGEYLFTVGERGSDPGKFNYPTNVAVDGKGDIYVVDTANFRVQIFDPQGHYLKSIGKLGDRPGEFARPKGIAIDSEGHIYVADAAFNNFQIFDNEGRLLLFVGEGGAEPGRFQLPAGLFIDDEDRIYVADQLNARVQVFQYLGEKWKKRQEEASTPSPAVKE
jgi:DNA-binding beta-propeller fold protein YncE